MSYVTRTNRSLKGLGCACQNPTFGKPVATLNGLGMDTYADLSWAPPGQGIQDGYFGVNASDMSVQASGTAANTLARTTPDGATPTGQAVVDAFSNNYGGAQPGNLPLYPNATADGLSFVHTPPPSLQCQIVNGLNNNPLLFIGAVFGVFYLANLGAHKARAYHAKRKAAKGAK